MPANRANPANLSGADAKALMIEAVAEQAQIPEKRPLFRELPPPSQFPVDALGPLKDAALAIQSRTQAPIEICAQSVLAVATLAVQAHIDVDLPGGGTKPVVNMFVSIAESGERKTSVDKIALASVRDVESQWNRDHKLATADYENRLVAWKTARAGVKKGAVPDMVAALGQIGLEPEAPPHPMLICSDVTPEALALHLEKGRPIAGLFTAEGGILVGGAAFNDESRMRTAALLNSLWDGEPIRRQRVGTGTTFLPGCRCCAHIMMQQVVADRLLGDSMLDGMGMLARMLIVAPESTAGSRLFKRDVPENAAILQAYNNQIAMLLRMEPATNNSRELAPRVLPLDTDASAAWIIFHDQCETAIRKNGELVTIKPFAAKLAEHAGRLAAVLTAYDDPQAQVVPLWAMESGIQLAEHYAMEMLRLHGGAVIPLELRRAQRLLDWWQRREESTLHLANIYQKGPPELRDAKPARAAVKVLIEHGWVERLEPGTEVEGKPRKDVFRLVA
ncbi:DUF3987 domain-containing protein [Sphingomonas sp. CL5.1]|uniref:YfjI family protein n=1 Tax=Sphingomonas sp. CL5.1 TaxID=2653203 RepID=UPI001582B18B|nr:YfjI family protein [Sphingomonas sp. CL5.1]QKR99203.1 DUF3987 domain-containing protein [Sphingomonas sp. CL5.1]